MKPGWSQNRRILWTIAITATIIGMAAWAAIIYFAITR